MAVLLRLAECGTGEFTPEIEEGILATLQDKGLYELNFVDYLSYLPLFLGIHGNIVANPLRMQDK